MNQATTFAGQDTGIVPTRDQNQGGIQVEDIATNETNKLVESYQVEVDEFLK